MAVSSIHVNGTPESIIDGQSVVDGKPTIITRKHSELTNNGSKLPTTIHTAPLLQQLLDQQIISVNQWHAFPHEQQIRLAEEQPEKLLNQLLQRGLLTSYQVDRLRMGDMHGLLIGNYRILNRLGAGGMGVVYKAEQILLQRPVAIKVLSSSCALDSRLHRRFWEEIRGIAQLQHPHIVTAFDGGELPGKEPSDPNIPYFVMEYLEGRDLEETVLYQGPFDLAQACKIISQVADALTEAHRHRLIHRDIKPSNIFLTTKNQVKLLDFGLARKNEPNKQGMTEPGMLLGTIGYMAPEQAIDPTAVDERSDFFSLGCALYWSLTQQHPFSIDMEDFEPRKAFQPPSIRSIRPDLPGEIEDIINKMIAFRPEDRFKDAITVYRALLPFVQGNERPEVLFSSSAKSYSDRKSRVLIIDDAPTVRYMCNQTLARSGFECIEAADAGAALQILSQQVFDLVLLDYHLPDMQGAELLKRVRAEDIEKNLKIIVISGMREQSDLAPLRLLGADDCIVKPFTSMQLLTIVRANLTAKEKQDLTEKEARTLSQENTRLKNSLMMMTTELTRTRDFLVQTLAEIIGERTFISSSRAIRLQRFSRCLCEEASRMPGLKEELTPEFITLIETWLPLLDVGHLLLPDCLLLKPDDLTDEEREMMQGHTILGADLLARIASKQPGQMAFFHMPIAIARYHHERYDGKGYPEGLIGTEIPFAARVARIVDVYDALRSQRAYKPALSHTQALQTIMEEQAGQYDPNLIRAFERAAHRFEQIYRELPD